MILAFILHRVIGYRKSIVRRNLRMAFPAEKTSELTITESRFYRYFSKLLTDYLALFLLPEKAACFTARYKNCDLIKSRLQNGQDVVLLAAHTGNWERLRDLPKVLQSQVITAYTPVKPASLNTLILKVRQRYGMSLIPRQQWYRHCLLSSRDNPKIFLAVADQRPSKTGSERISFFGLETDFHQGAFRLAKQRNAAILYVDTEYDSTGICTFRFLPLPEKQPEQAYYTHLEQTIRRAPACWLWSHRRWKFNETDQSSLQHPLAISD